MEKKLEAVFCVVKRRVIDSYQTEFEGPHLTTVMNTDKSFTPLCTETIKIYFKRNSAFLYLQIKILQNYGVLNF